MNIESIAMTPVWRKSSYSGNAGGECIEIAALSPVVGVRDSKVNKSPVITANTEAWVAFLDATRR